LFLRQEAVRTHYAVSQFGTERLGLAGSGFSQSQISSRPFSSASHLPSLVGSLCV